MNDCIGNEPREECLGSVIRENYLIAMHILQIADAIARTLFRDASESAQTLPPKTEHKTMEECLLETRVMISNTESCLLYIAGNLGVPREEYENE